MEPFSLGIRALGALETVEEIGCKVVGILQAAGHVVELVTLKSAGQSRTIAPPAAPAANPKPKPRRRR